MIQVSFCYKIRSRFRASIQRKKFALVVKLKVKFRVEIVANLKKLIGDAFNVIAKTTIYPKIIIKNYSEYLYFTPKRTVVSFVNCIRSKNHSK